MKWELIGMIKFLLILITATFAFLEKTNNKTKTPEKPLADIVEEQLK